MACSERGRQVAARTIAVILSGLALAATALTPAVAKDLDTFVLDSRNGADAMASAVTPGGLDGAYARVLRNPGDTELNLRFARLAEASGYARWALATYERILLNDPNNAEAQAGYLRLRRAFQPAITLVTVEMGTTYESNPTYYLPPKRGEMQGYVGGSVRDERNLGDVRWRTTATVYGRLHEKEDELNYGYAGLSTGPVFDVFPDWRIHPSIGAAAAYFDDHPYYGEASAGVLFENGTPSIYRALQLRGAYRSYDDFFPTSHGFYAEARGKIGIANPIGPKTAFTLSPWVLWSDLKGSGISPLVSDVQPGAYVEWGGKGEFYWTATNWLVLGWNFTYLQRNYQNEVDVVSGVKRRDDIAMPGASISFTNLLAKQTDLRLDYRHIWDSSSDRTKSFDDNIVSMSVIHRLDPIVSQVPTNLH